MPVSSGKHNYNTSTSDIDVGCEVRIKSKSWYDSMPKDNRGVILRDDLDGTYVFSAEMSRLCGNKYYVIYKREISWYVGNPKVIEPIAFTLSTSPNYEMGPVSDYCFTRSMLELCQ